MRGLAFAAGVIGVALALLYGRRLVKWVGGN
jgi:hypothetical protein